MSGLLSLIKAILTLFVKNVKPSPVETPKKEVLSMNDTNNVSGKGIIYFKNGSSRLQLEFKAIETKNPELHQLLVDTCAYCKATFGKDIVVTMIYRTQEEQDEIYENDPKYKLKKFKSPHQFGHAFDLRSSTFEAEEIKKLVDYLNSVYDKVNYYKWTAKCHTVGDGAEHFHVQFCKKE